MYSSANENWKCGCTVDERALHRRIYESDPSKQQEKLIVVVTWNVLFDLYDDGLEADSEQQKKQTDDDNTVDHHLSAPRWKLLCFLLELTGADLIALQEVTPAFVRILCDCEWVRADYASSCSPLQAQSVDPSGGTRVLFFV